MVPVSDVLLACSRYQIADNMIMGASRNGTWVSLKNVHLCIAWLPELERKLFRARAQGRSAAQKRVF